MLYFDESGYTGPDLINSKQPYFSLASMRKYGSRKQKMA